MTDTRPGGNRVKVVFMDLEMKPIPREFRAERAICAGEVIQFGAVKLEDDHEVASYCSVVKPEYGAIPAYIEDMTGVTNGMTVGAATFREGLSGFAEFCADADTIYAWSGTDLAQLEAESRLKDTTALLEPLVKKWSDYQRRFTDCLHLDRAISLEKALDIALLSMDGHQHDALCDARNTAKLFLSEKDLAVSKRLRKVAAQVNSAPTTYSQADKFAGCLAMFGGDDGGEGSGEAE